MEDYWKIIRYSVEISAANSVNMNTTAPIETHAPQHAATNKRTLAQSTIDHRHKINENAKNDQQLVMTGSSVTRPVV